MHSVPYFLAVSSSQPFALYTKRNLERPISAFGNRCCAVFWVRVCQKLQSPTTGDVKVPTEVILYGSALLILFVTNPSYTNKIFALSSPQRPQRVELWTPPDSKPLCAAWKVNENNGNMTRNGSASRMASYWNVHLLVVNWRSANFSPHWLVKIGCRLDEGQNFRASSLVQTCAPSRAPKQHQSDNHYLFFTFMGKARAHMENEIQRLRMLRSCYSVTCCWWRNLLRLAFAVALQLPQHVVYHAIDASYDVFVVSKSISICIGHHSSYEELYNC